MYDYFSVSSVPMDMKQLHFFAQYIYMYIYTLCIENGISFQPWTSRG